MAEGPTGQVPPPAAAPTGTAAPGPGRAGLRLLVTTATGREVEGAREVLAAVGPGRLLKVPFKGNALLEAGADWPIVQARLLTASTTCVARVSPVLTEVEPDLQRIAAAAADLATRLGAAGGETFTVESQRRGLTAFGSPQALIAVVHALEAAGLDGRYEGPTDWTVTVDLFPLTAFLGMARSALTVRKRVTRARIYAPGTRPTSRAQHKILEAVEAFGIGAGAGRRALDLGAAPGGWTRALAEQGWRVDAVDPAALAPEVLALPGVTHHPIRAEAFLAGDPTPGPYDLVACDMNVEPGLAAPLVARAAAVVRDSGHAILTVKYVTRDRDRHREEALAALSGAWQDLRFRRVKHNRLEVTLHGRKGQSL